MASPLSYEIREAVVTVCGKAFWYRDPLRSFFLSCGVPTSVYDRYADESKYKIARGVLADLDAMGDEGYLIQRRLVTELAKMRRPPDENVPDMDAAVSSLRRLKELALAQKLLVAKNKSEATTHAQEARAKQTAIIARAQKMDELRRTYYGLASATDDPQSRGYGLEDLLSELFQLNEIAYRPPYRAGSEQIDGHFAFKSFDYLVEARWRSSLPNQADLGAFKMKIDKKISSTRGLFVSISGFRPEVVEEFNRGVASNIVLMDGQDLALILEGHVSLVDALDMKIQKAAQEGIVYFPLGQRFG